MLIGLTARTAQTEANTLLVYVLALEGLQTAVRIEWLTIAWMTLEALASFAAGQLARSLLLTAFGFDRVIDLITGSVLLWRLRPEARGAASESVEAASIGLSF